MEIIPPSFTGDPNSARCPEECFRLGMYGLNAALWYDKLGFRRIIDVGSRFNSDHMLAAAEEHRARRDEAAGRVVKSRRDQIGEFRYRRWARWRKERNMHNM
mmetsp:Transcript_7259/g.11413  ORF Transcript_7259/g.11413 Transcript_7259/m.11413 type:complete len:102 (+) Transcript_7259:217-522(+)